MNFCRSAVTVVKEFKARDSYALWTPQESSYSAVNETTQKDTDISVMFRTRQTDGILFFAVSFSRLEHAILEVGFFAVLIFILKDPTN